MHFFSISSGGFVENMFAPDFLYSYNFILVHVGLQLLSRNLSVSAQPTGCFWQWRAHLKIEPFHCPDVRILDAAGLVGRVGEPIAGNWSIPQLSRHSVCRLKYSRPSPTRAG
jgi:hypothetical protein